QYPRQLSTHPTCFGGELDYQKEAMFRGIDQSTRGDYACRGRSCASQREPWPWWWTTDTRVRQQGPGLPLGGTRPAPTKRPSLGTEMGGPRLAQEGHLTRRSSKPIPSSNTSPLPK